MTPNTQTYKVTYFDKEMDIYAGHGSFFLLTSSFFEKYDKIHLHSHPHT